jgi:hypothetical protein
MAKTSAPLLGSQALKALEVRSSADLKRARQLVEDAAAADISSYFSGAGFGAPGPQITSTLVAASLAGGQLGFNSLLTRLASSDVNDSDRDMVANEILEIVSPLAKILNYARFRTGAIQSYIAQCEIPSLKLQAMLLSKVDLEKYESLVKSIKNFNIDGETPMRVWIAQVDELCDFLSNSQFENTDQTVKSASKSKKGTVSTKSISSYSKHWKSYSYEVLSQELGLKWNGLIEESIDERVKPLESYKPRTWTQIQKNLNESISTRRAFSSSAKNVKRSSSSKLITEEKDLDGRLLTLTFNSSGIDQDLIQPTLNSIRGQLLRAGKKDTISVNMKTDSSSLSIEIENPRKEDLKTIEILLNSHR